MELILIIVFLIGAYILHKLATMRIAHDRILHNEWMMKNIKPRSQNGEEAKTN